MKTLIGSFALTLALASLALPAYAQESDGDDADTPPAHTTTAPKAAAKPVSAAMSQRDKMRKCNADAHGMKGTERREFMSHCLSKKRAG